MIRAFYNLKTAPFSKEINPKDIFMAHFTPELFNRLDYMREKRGIMLVTGQPGTGKTLYLRAFVEKLNENLYKAFYIPLSSVSTLEFYRQLSVYLSGQSYWKKSVLFKTIQESIKDYVSNNKKIPVIIFDESEFLKNENFLEFQIIANFNMDSSDPCLFIILAQPHLRERLSTPILQPFNQRISLKFHIPPFSREETSAYVIHHLGVAGTKQSIFSENALSAIYQNSGGIPRIINAISLNTMTIGALEKKEALTEDEVYRASKEL